MTPLAAALALYATAWRVVHIFTRSPRRDLLLARADAARRLAEALGATPEQIAAVTLAGRRPPETAPQHREREAP